MTYHKVTNKINTTSATSGVVTVSPSTTPWFTYIFCGVYVAQSFLQFAYYGETCLNRTLNKPESFIN